MSIYEQKHNKPFIQKIEIIHKVDEYPDLSYLEQDYFNDNPKYPLCSQEDNEKYQKQDKERIEEYNNGNWYSMGIIAKTEIYIPNILLGYIEDKNFSYRIVPLTSGGIWGIESDSGEEYIKEEENSQIEELKDLLKVLNIEIPDNVQIVRNK